MSILYVSCMLLEQVYKMKIVYVRGHRLKKHRIRRRTAFYIESVLKHYM